MEDKKISMVETMFLVLFIVPLDIIELVAGVVPGLSYIAIGYDLAAMGGLFMYFHMKGGNYALPTAGSGIEAVFPGIDALPIRTITLIVAIYMTNHPNAGKIASLGSVNKVVGGLGDSKTNTHSQEKPTNQKDNQEPMRLAA
jgi:hypothetical protein